MYRINAAFPARQMPIAFESTRAPVATPSLLLDTGLNSGACSARAEELPGRECQRLTQGGLVAKMATGSGVLPDYDRRLNMPENTTIAVKQAAAPIESGVASVVRMTVHRRIVSITQTNPMIFNVERMLNVRISRSTRNASPHGPR